MAETTTITTAMLQNLLPNVMFPKGYANGNLDDLKTVGLYQIAPEKCSGLPDGIYQYGVMKVYSVGEFTVQEYISHMSTPDNPGVIAVRMYFSSWEKWASWRILT